ncbi:MAG: hypothetical protein M1832_000452 [Thelocarpon impressellum]|nr:MAG: hypothetical protein M1832_000452 [Thelocarpon impressellum]
MAVPLPNDLDHVSYPDLRADADVGSDYGSDFTGDEERLVNELLEARTRGDGADDEGLERRTLARVGWHGRRELPLGARKGWGDGVVEVEVEPGNGNEKREDLRQRPSEPATDVKSLESDARSPLQRFRTAPQKALSVTDLVSPGWCELQYWYTLTKHGRKRRTPAMRQGSAVHKTLEYEVHTTVAVDVETKEDGWGLRIWNVIQGLRTLRQTGMTRELEVWGVVDGLVVNGVIDVLSYDCPDPTLEKWEEERSAFPPDQTRLDDFLQSPGKTPTPRKASSRKIYITDVKTRASRTLPQGASFRPTLLQLMLYHRLLSHLATNMVDADVLFDRYDLDPSVRFSDAFVAQMASLYNDDDWIPDRSQDSLQVLMANNSLRELWSVMIGSFIETFPRGPASLGAVLQAEYRSPADGNITGSKTFLHNEGVLGTYLADALKWWRGERGATGVPVEEAYKCGICEFAEGCEWRRAKVDEATASHRSKRSGG